HFYLTGKMRHRIRFDPNACNALFLTLHERRPRPTKGVEYALPFAYPKTLRVVADKMGWEGKNKTVPIVTRAIFRAEFIRLAIRRTTLLFGRIRNPRILKFKFQFQSVAPR